MTETSSSLLLLARLQNIRGVVSCHFIHILKNIKYNFEYYFCIVASKMQNEILSD